MTLPINKEDEECENSEDCKSGLVCYEKGKLVNNLSLYEQLTGEDKSISHDKTPEWTNMCQKMYKLI